MGKQGCGRRLTDKERLEIIALTRQNPRIKHVELAARYRVNESTIRKWRAEANALRIKARYEHGASAARDQRQRAQSVRNPQFDAALYEWVTAMIRQDMDIPPVKVREKARALAATFEGMDGFKASSGWYYRFCRRYGLTGSHSNPGSTSTMAATIVASDVPVPPGGDTCAVSLGAPAVDSVSTSIVPVPGLSLSLQGSAITQEAAISKPITTSSVTKSVVGAVDTHLGTASVHPTARASALTMPTSFSPAQAAAAHLMQHFKNQFSFDVCARLADHLAQSPTEAELYLVMDPTARLAYVRSIRGAATSGDTIDDADDGIVDSIVL